MRAVALPGFDPSSFRPHALCGPEAVWPERNCYVDPWIALVHALGLDPHAMLGPALVVDFEGDQWTFFKPSHDELREAYGLQVQELTRWRPLLDHALEHAARGNVIAVETDAFWLPDTAGTDYRSNHVKTTIFLLAVDATARRLTYLHNAGVRGLEGEDFEHVLGDRVGAPTGALPLYTEFVRTDRLRLHPGDALRARGRAQLRDLLDRRPRSNPIRRFAARYAEDLPWIRQGGLDRYHAWAFASTRQMGATHELAARWVAWLELGETAEPATRALDKVARSSKSLILKGARAATAKQAVDVTPWFDELADAWDVAFDVLERVAP